MPFDLKRLDSTLVLGKPVDPRRLPSTRVWAGLSCRWQHAQRNERVVSRLAPAWTAWKEQHQNHDERKRVGCWPSSSSMINSWKKAPFPTLAQPRVRMSKIPG